MRDSREHSVLNGEIFLDTPIKVEMLREHWVRIGVPVLSRYFDL